jgi:hypothetical protein
MPSFFAPETVSLASAEAEILSRAGFTSSHSVAVSERIVIAGAKTLLSLT